MVDDEQKQADSAVDPLDGVSTSVDTQESPASPDATSMNDGVPAVSAGGTKNVFVAAMIFVVAAIIIFNIVTGDEEKVENESSNRVKVGDSGGKIIPLPPPVPPPPPPPAPPPPPPPPPPGMSDNTTSQDGGAVKKGLTLSPERREAGLVVAGNELVNLGFLEGGAEGSGGVKGIAPTTAVQVNATTAGKPINLIAQGKMIDAILETAINSDLSGILRAVVSRDVYAEAGKRVLIPKGSRLVGSYDITVKRGQSRVFIVWNRVLRPDGVDIIITSPGSDRLGRAGVEGQVDDKYLEVFSNAILFSSLTVAFAFSAETAIDSDGLSETENTSGSLTTAGKPSDVAIVESIDDFGSVVKNVAEEVVDLRPTISIDQGTRMKVFVNKDLKFPSVIESDVVYIR